ncbi:MAG TPA: hypothetical protein VKD70_17010 [Candidatus Acidoferrum sp.]|nr:hypothetical protein [Candidatus Acidoferrum sp.]
MALSRGENEKQRALLVVARQEGQAWKTKQLDSAPSSMPVIWSEKPGKYTSVYREKSLRAPNPVIVFCGYNSWAVVYAWIHDKVDKVWLSD